MAACFLLDPLTLDLKANARGGFDGGTTARCAITLQLNTRFASWPVDPNAGSRWFDLEAFKAAPAPMIADEGRRALGYLVALGLISDVTVEAEEFGLGKIALRTTCRDTSTGQPTDVLTAVKGAG